MSQRWSNFLVWAVVIVGSVLVSKAAWAGHPVNTSSLLNLLIFALPFAGIYAMYASGLVVVYTTTGIFNFAQGGIGMFCAYLDWELVVHRGWPQYLVLPFVVLVFAPLLGVLLDRAIMRHLVGKPLVVQLMVTVGLMFTFIALANMIWNQRDAHSLPALFEGKGFDINGVTLTYARTITITSAIVLAFGLRFLLFHTRIGIAMRAVVDNRDLAGLTGARSAVLSSFAWALGCAVGALAGILVAPEGAMATAALTLLVINAFSAAIVGRMRSLPLTYLGALILALAGAWMNNFLQFGGRWTNVADNLPTIMLFIVLLLLPRASLTFSRINPVKRVERVSTVRDTAIGMAVLLVVMVSLSYFISDHNIDRFSLGMCTALVALSLVPLTGWAGQVSLAPLAFAGLGAIAYARLGGAHGSLWAVLLATLITIPVGALLALPAMRVQGLYLALATLAFAATVEALIYPQPWAIGDVTRNVTRIQFFGIRFESPRPFLILMTVIFGLAGIGVQALRRGAFGRRMLALRDSEAASATVGINIFATKIAVFSLSAGMAGFAGAFLAMRYEQLSPQNPSLQFGVLAGLAIVLALVIGGVGFVAGALFAGVFGLITIIVQENWHLSLWTQFAVLAPGLAVLGIIQNPSGAVVPIGEGFARLLPWRHDARRDYEEQKALDAEPEVGELGLERGFDEAEVLYIDRELGISDLVPKVPVGGL